MMFSHDSSNYINHIPQTGLYLNKSDDNLGNQTDIGSSTPNQTNIRISSYR
jgi:hypothetical protein